MKAFASEGREGEGELNHASERLFSLGSALRADLTAVNLTAGAVLAKRQMRTRHELPARTATMQYARCLFFGVYGGGLPALRVGDSVLMKKDKGGAAPTLRAWCAASPISRC
jgi:hypothetical protein